MKLTTESTVINDNKLNTNIDNAQTMASDAKVIATSAQGTAENALGKANSSVVTDTLHYLATSQGKDVTTSTAGWTTTVQAMTATNKYLWTYHTYTRANGTTVNSAPVITGTYGEKGNTGDKGDKGDTGAKGDTGVGVTKLQTEYYLSDTEISLSGGSWDTSVTYVSGKYIWTREKVTYSDGSTNYSTAVYNGALTSACSNAYSALQIANSTSQYFWVKTSGSDTGAHITEKTQAEFEADPSGGNLLARSNGIAVRDGYNEVATFGINGARVGLDGSANVIITNEQTIFHGNNGELVGSITTGQEISGEFNDTLPHQYVGTGYLIDTTNVLFLDKYLTYPPQGDISLKLGITNSQTRTIPPTSDYDVTTDGIKVEYSAESRRVKATYISGHTESVKLDYSTLYPVSYKINGGSRYAVSLSSNKRTATMWKKPTTGTTIEAAALFGGGFFGNTVSFTPGTSATKTSKYDYESQYLSQHYSASIKYDGNKTITITSFSPTSGITVEVGAVHYYVDATFLSDSSVATYDRRFLAPQFVFGVFNSAGNYSLVTEFGEGLRAGASSQVIVGKYNRSGSKAFYIGAGNSSNDRANAMEVGWDGNVTISGQLTQGSDRRLKEHIAYLGDEAVDFINELKPAHYIKDKQHHVGFYAQDVAETDKWDCMTGEMNGYMTLGYSEIIAPLVAYVQKLEKRITELERSTK